MEIQRKLIEENKRTIYDIFMFQKLRGKIKIEIENEYQLSLLTDH